MSTGRPGAGRSTRPHPPAQDRPGVPADVNGQELSPPVRRELATALPDRVAERVAGHLVMAGRLIASDPEQAYLHALAARKAAPRLAVVREAAGEAAYAAGRYAEALAELRALRRMTGTDEFLPAMADCERALGRPERAVQIAAEAGPRLTGATAVEMALVSAGARLDLGQPEEALRRLADLVRRLPERGRSASRVRYAYAEALLAVGDEEAASAQFARAATADPDAGLDAAERGAALEGLTVIDTTIDADEPVPPQPEG